MSKPIEFQCKWDTAEVLPEIVLHSAGIDYRQAHTERQAMALVAEGKCIVGGDSVCRVPFCVTVEAEAFGAEVMIPDDDTGPTIRGYRYTSMEQLAALDEIDLTSGRINEVLNCIAILRDRGNVVAVNVEGPFTILGLLIDSAELFKGIYLHREILEQALRVLENSIVKYAEACVAQGATIISYADPTGALELVGLKLYRELSGKSSYNILKRLEERLEGALVHLCGISSLSMERAGFCSAKPVAVPGARTYGDSLCRVAANQQEIKLVGHNCMKSTPAVQKNPVVWQIVLK
ncbi:uroporphyrinogen decarboxylase family protein [Sporomusa acidovorans]|uniref:Uroporphyrinogen decarboxylase (URO-D) domain-containing protein n=1 Tax=Sporomusa acidovorans (strain ATCC 49682 / DSM 3132 / Mol) TaxID=1123286 RepID=A0ABZ3IWA6_SPOA4|nr:uroporphyrinogen decarboxylase family protein [Sporomusa acidovorans]OZC24033.1 methylcobalamin:coenzyme M methyltransferase [Sporomusa acidovorans DSM 3132]SDF58468.1 Uroporphyrinogen decarboxylase (URO-D) [Sporomusa acidovorans]